MKCRLCDAAVSRSFVDLGMHPLSNAYVDRRSTAQAEKFYPLHAFVCDRCLLVQVPELESPERIFADYAYLSSMSDSWLQHCRRHAHRMTETLGLDARSLVIEVASNDGYLLRSFKEKGVPVLGIEPAANVAAIAESAGIPTIARFFGASLAEEIVAGGRSADLLVGNNVLAHVPNLNDFVKGLKTVLGARGVLTMEFPHLGRLLAEKQFDTIYHEHFSYFSFATAERLFAAHGIEIFDVEQLPTHGGSLRILGRHAGQTGLPLDARVGRLRSQEESDGTLSFDAYERFAEDVREVKRMLLDFLIRVKREKKRVVAYGAAAKGNTLLNYCGIRGDFIDYVVDRSPLKQGKLLPGSRIPVEAPERIEQTRPDYVVILPWNLKDELVAKLAFVRGWGGRLVVPIPEVEVLP